MTRKVFATIAAIIAIALTLLSLRQARIVQVNRMNTAWRTLEHEDTRWRALRLELAAAARPGMTRPEAQDDAWAAMVERRVPAPLP